ncbi:MAG: hypothetical protein ACPGUV_12235 [Polyangiales bacterium]
MTKTGDAAQPGPGNDRSATEAALHAAQAAFDRGDFRQVRRCCAALGRAEGTHVTTAQRQAAQALLARTRVDPAQLAVLVATFGLLVFLAVHYVL